MFDIDSLTLWTIKGSEAETVFYFKDGASKAPRPDKKISPPGIHSIFETGKPFLNNKAKFDEDSEDESNQITNLIF